MKKRLWVNVAVEFLLEESDFEQDGGDLAATTIVQSIRAIPGVRWAGQQGQVGEAE